MTRLSPTKLFLFLTFAWGGIFVAIKVGLTSVPPIFFAAIRFDIGAAILFGYLLLTQQRLLPVGRSEKVAIVASGVFIFAMSNVCLFIGQQFVTVGLASMTYGLAPLTTVILARMFLPNEYLGKVGLAGITFGFFWCLAYLSAKLVFRFISWYWENYPSRGTAFARGRQHSTPDY